tara:strand:- start:133 stop:267 length:135 start_codon:yes stop_codon:yes gene_type:complete
MKLGITIPSTNTTVQPEMGAMRPEGVTKEITEQVRGQGTVLEQK